MSLVVSQSFCNSCSCKNFNETKQDSIKTLPDELVLKVFFYLNIATLGTICCVNKAWKQLANDPILLK